MKGRIRRRGSLRDVHYKIIKNHPIDLKNQSLNLEKLGHVTRNIMR